MELYKHQQELILKDPKRHLLAWECGTGKTLAAITLAKINMTTALVICPKSLKDQWREQIPGDWALYTKEEFKKHHKILPKYNCIICDEAHTFSGLSSAMHKSLILYIKIHKPERIYLLTATPYMSTPWNIYALAKILGHEPNYISFKRKCFSEVKMGRKIIPVIKKGIEKEIAAMVGFLGNTVRMDECIDIPEQVFQTEYFELTKEQTQAVSEVIDILQIVRYTKIHEICGGSLKGDGYVADNYYPSEKLERLTELCREHKKIVIVCRYNNEIKMIYEKISKFKKVEIINGDTKDKNNVVKACNTSDDVAVIINASCSEGYELPSFPIMVFYSYSFSLKDYLQIIGRIQRINNIKKNVYLSLIVKGTIDEDIYKCIQRKENFDIAIYDKTRNNK